MSTEPAPQPTVGTIVWTDLTVPDAERVRDFYSAVVGWKPEPVLMSGDGVGDYNDYSMNAPGSGTTVSGVCHARGVNANMPPLWMVYIRVENLERALARVRELGGEVIDGPRPMGKNAFAAIKDPAGAVCGLIE